jgi:hypothetical protein
MKYLLIFGLSFMVGLLILFGRGSGLYLITIFPYVIILFLLIFIVWFGISLINIQRERNDILAEIAKKLEIENK